MQGVLFSSCKSESQRMLFLQIATKATLIHFKKINSIFWSILLVFDQKFGMLLEGSLLIRSLNLSVFCIKKNSPNCVRKQSAQQYCHLLTKARKVIFSPYMNSYDLPLRDKHRLFTSSSDMFEVTGTASTTTSGAEVKQSQMSVFLKNSDYR